MYNKFQESRMGWQKGAMNARQVSRKSPGMAKRGDECTTSFTKVSWGGKKGRRMYDKFHESLLGWQKGAMNVRQVSRKSHGMAKRG